MQKPPNMQPMLPKSAPAELYLSRTLDGRRVVSGHLGAEDAAVVEEALQAAGDGLRGKHLRDSSGQGPCAALRHGAVGLARQQGGTDLLDLVLHDVLLLVNRPDGD